MNKLEQAKQILEQENATFCAITADGPVISALRGIAPIMNLLQTDEKTLQDACVADRVIGKAAAFLLIKADISALYAKVISRHALDILKESRIEVTYENCVPYIVNRRGDGMCPMEASVLDTDDVEKAYELLSKIRKT